MAMKEKEKEKKKRHEEEEEEEKSLSKTDRELRKAMNELDETASGARTTKPNADTPSRGSLIQRGIALMAKGLEVMKGGALTGGDYDFDDPTESYMGGDSDHDDTKPDKGARGKDRGQESLESERQTPQEAADEDEDEPEERETIVTGRTMRSRPRNDAGERGRGAFGARRSGLPDEVMHSRSGNREDVVKSHEATVYEELAGEGDFAEVVEASPALERLTNVIARSHGVLMAEIADLRENNRRLRKSMKLIKGALAKSLAGQAELKKSLSTGVRGYSMNGANGPGTMAIVDGVARMLEVPKNVDALALQKGFNPQEAQLIKSQNAEALQNAVNDGVVDADATAVYASTGQLPMHMLNQKIIQQYGIKVLQ